MSSRIFGSGIRRREDPRLITGSATYTHDITLPGMVHAAMLRSSHAHARITRIDTRQARLEETGRAQEEPLPADATAEQHDWRARYWDHHRLRYGELETDAYEQLGIAMMDQTPVTDRLGEIDCPTLVVVGEQDVPFLDVSRRMAGQLPDSTLTIVPDAAHSPQLENEAAWLDAILQHLERSRP